MLLSSNKRRPFSSSSAHYDSGTIRGLHSRHIDFASKNAQHPTSPNKCSVKSFLLLFSLLGNMILLIYLVWALHQREIGISSEYHSPLERIKQYYIRKHDGLPQEGSSFHDGNVRDRDHVIQQQHAITKSSAPYNHKPNNKTHWCVITHAHIPFFASRYFKHFPHTAETLLPCWSYFYEKQVLDRCGVHWKAHCFTLDQGTDRGCDEVQTIRRG